jgi:hypothetical protein
MTVSGAGYSATGITTPTTIAPAQSATLSVKFAPAATGAVNGTVALVTTQGQTLNITASATGVQAGLSVTPASVSFGSVTTGSTGSQTVQLKNTGTSTLTITQAAVTGTGFSDTGLTLPQSIAAGTTANFNVQFAPSAAGSASGTLTLTSNAPNSPAAIALSGTGVASTQTLLITPTSLSFGSVTAGTTASQTFSISNSGNANVAISSITASGTGFAITSGGSAVTLTPTQSVTVTVQFAPTVAGADSGSVSIVSNATGSPATVTLSGTGVAAVQHSAALSWTASTSTVSGYNVYRGTVSGGLYTKINSSLVAGVSYTDTTVASGTTYYYVTTAVDSSNNESSYSNEVQAIIP